MEIKIKKLAYGLGLSTLFLIPTLAFAQDYSADLALEPGSLEAKGIVLENQTVRLYAKVKNNSDQDLRGTVKFYDETRGTFIGADQPVSVVAGGTDDVFIDWEAGSSGKKNITARILPWDDEGDNSSNNKISTSIYVDVDTDGDGIPNQSDPDDDNDAVIDSEDAFPLDPRESEDTDGDGIGNHADDDDDNDGVLDIEDDFPTDPNEVKDTDDDGYGDNMDAFPEDSSEWKDEDGDGIGSNKDTNDQNKLPTAIISLEKSSYKLNEVIVFQGFQSQDEDGEIVNYQWYLDDEEVGQKENFEKSFQTPGRHEIKLVVTDDKGESSSDTISIELQSTWQAFSKIGLGGLFIIILCVFLVIRYKKHKKNLSKKEK